MGQRQRAEGSGMGVGGVRADPSADIATFYAHHFHGLAVQIYAYTGDFGTAQEIVQEAFCRAIPRWARIMAYDDPVGWVRRVAFNLAISRWRRAKHAVAFLHGHRQEHAPAPNADHVDLVAALKTLPDKHRRVVVLHHLGDVPVADIARSEGVPEGTVRVWLHRGRSALAAALGEPVEAKEQRDA
jgi:RNA polymerase sigma-70 factor, ECF subfamily